MPRKKPTHGGKREGAGRPSGDSDLVQWKVRITPEAAEAIDQAAERAGIDRRALVEQWAAKLAKR